MDITSYHHHSIATQNSYLIIKTPSAHHPESQTHPPLGTHHPVETQLPSIPPDTHHPEVGAGLELCVDTVSSMLIVQLQTRGGGQVCARLQTHRHHHVVGGQLWTDVVK